MSGGKVFPEESVWTFADELGVRVYVANQISWPFFGRGTANMAQKASL